MVQKKNDLDNVLCLHEDRELDEQEDKLCGAEAEDTFLQDTESEFNDKENLGKDN